MTQLIVLYRSFVLVCFNSLMYCRSTLQYRLSITAIHCSFVVARYSIIIVLHSSLQFCCSTSLFIELMSYMSYVYCPLAQYLLIHCSIVVVLFLFIVASLQYVVVSSQYDVVHCSFVVASSQHVVVLPQYYVVHYSIFVVRRNSLH